MLWYVVTAIVAFAVGVGVMVLLYIAKLKRDAKTIADAEAEALRIKNEAIKAAENKKREAMLEAKEEIHRDRAE